MWLAPTSCGRDLIRDGPSSGSTKAVAPSLVSASGVGDGKIEFNESFKLRVTLLRDMSIKTGDSDTFLKNCIEFNMYEPRRDKTVKGQLLATAVVDFAKYGIVKDGLEVGVLVNCKRTFSNTIQRMLFLRIEAVDKSNRVRSDSMNEENIEESESASVTDDDVFSQSSMAAISLTSRSNGSLNPQKEVLVQDKTVIELVAEAKDDMGSEVNDAGDQQLYMPVKSAHFVYESGYNSGSLRSRKVQQLEQKVQSLEVELREVVAIKVGLCSIVAEHGSSVDQVHAPARRLSRLYLHSCIEKSQFRRASSARSIVLG
ncbi:hypothetical protein Tco_0703986 [Tanacetum coccineum]|uniref:C2 NT-type domain-containing protein n=1 Tax=Tanacetum coccineum TaxID=301880 RepID=A0ABQ4Y0D7_9ASTR